MTRTEETDHHEFGALSRLIIKIGAGDEKILRTCPIRDVHNVMTIGWLLIIVWVWQSVLFTMVGHMMLARPGEWRFEVIAGAMLIATVVMLVDSYVIVRSSWHLQGISELQRGGLDLPSPVGARIKNGIFLAVRLMLSTVLAMLTALFLSILLFEKDLTADQERQFQKVNAPLLARISGQVDDVIAKLKGEHEEIRKRLSTMADEEKLLRATVIDPEGDNSELKAALERVPVLNEAKAEAQRELTAAEKHAADELGGARLPGTSGIPGYGPLRRAADEKIASARRKLQGVISDIEEAQKHIGTLRLSLKDVTGSKRLAAEAKLAEIAIQRKEKEERLAIVEAEFKKREQDRDRVIRTAFENDPAYHAKENGFLARLEGLERISAQFHVKFVVVIFHIGLFGIELAAVLAKIATFIPASYTTILAWHDLQIPMRWAVRLKEEADKIHSGRDEPPEGAPTTPLPPDPKPQPAKQEGEPVPAEAEDIGETLRQVFPQAQTTEEEDKPPHNDTAFRKRRGRPNGKSWKPWLKRRTDPDQPGDGEASVS